MKKVLTALALGSVILAPLSQAQAGDKLLEILKGKGIITDEQFQELEKESQKEVKAFYKDGFKMESGDKNFSLQVNGRVQADFRYFNDSDKNDTFDIRRAYLSGAGTLFKYYDYKVEVDFGGGTSSTLKDAYINYKYFKDAQIKMGQFYYPYGNENTASDKYYVFIEPAAISLALAPGRDRGIQVHGSPMNGLVSYQAGIFNGAGDNKADTNDDFDFAARVVLNPTRGSEGPFQAWIGGSIGWGQQVGANSSDIKIQPEGKTGNSYFSAAIPTSRNYDRTKMGAEATLQYGPAMLKGEYLRTEYDFEKKADVEGYYVTASWFLTGDRKTIKNGQTDRQQVKKPFDPSRGQWGAWELAARYSWFEVDDKFFTANALYPGQSAVSKTSNVNGGDAWTAGINWYPNNMTRVMVNWVHSEASTDIAGGTSNIFTHDSDGKTDAEDALLVRLQIEF